MGIVTLVSFLSEERTGGQCYEQLFSKLLKNLLFNNGRLLDSFTTTQASTHTISEVFKDVKVLLPPESCNSPLPRSSQEYLLNLY